jgi:hypothetical protein
VIGPRIKADIIQKEEGFYYFTEGCYEFRNMKDKKFMVAGRRGARLCRLNKKGNSKQLEMVCENPIFRKHSVCDLHYLTSYGIMVIGTTGESRQH